MLARIATAVLCASLAAGASAAPKQEDAKGCTDSTALTRMPGCWIARCKSSPFDVAKINTTEKKPAEVEGEVQQIVYYCQPEVSGAAIWGNVQGALEAAGYDLTYKSNYFTTRYWVTGKKGGQWVAVYAEKANYTLTTVKERELEQVIEATADGWAEQINKNGRVSVYGINFDTGKATLRPESEKVLEEVAKLLTANPDWYLLVAGHTDDVGSDAVNLPLSQKRAEAVIAWLGGKGIERQRLTGAGFGARKPLADNATDEGKAKNRRVDLIKLY